MSTQWADDEQDVLYGSRAQPSVRDAGPLPRPFEWPALLCLLLTIAVALSTERAHLHGHAAGATSGFLLAVGLVALVCSVASAVSVGRRWFVGRQGDA